MSAPRPLHVLASMIGLAVACDHTVDLAPVDAVPGCVVATPCPTPAPGQISVCGAILDVLDDAPPAACDGARCDLGLRFYDALDWAADPGAASPLIPPAACVDGRGRFQAIGMPEPPFGSLAIVVDDASGADAHLPTMVAVSNRATQAPVEAYATRRATDVAWSQAAGVAPSLATRGVAVVIFTHGGRPAAGVAVRRDQALVPGDDLYFADPDHVRRQLDPSRPRTGDNGTALLLDVPAPARVDGIGGEPAGCAWEEALAVTPPGTVSVWKRPALTASGGPCL